MQGEAISRWYETIFLAVEKVVLSEIEYAMRKGITNI